MTSDLQDSDVQASKLQDKAGQVRVGEELDLSKLKPMIWGESTVYSKP